MIYCGIIIIIKAGSTALHCALNSIETVAVLLEKGANIDKQNNVRIYKY